MGTGANRSPIPSSSTDWDRPFTDQELVAIEAAFQSATYSSSFSIKRRHHDSYEDRPTARRRLPDSISGFRRQPTSSTGHIRCGGFGSESSPMRIPDSFSLSPCPRNRFNNNLYHASSSQAKFTMKYPAMTFRGHIVYSRTVSEVEKAAKELLEIVETKKRGVGQVILGFDIEWRPTFRRGVAPGKVAVMQICGDSSHCYVMHIIHSGIPQSLQSLLEDPTSLKVGVGIANDAFKVFKDHNVSIKTLEDLSGLANQKIGGDQKKWGLASLAEMLVCKQLPKPAKIRLGNWETDILSKEQLQYAATDAFASWYLYLALKSLPDSVDNKSEELGKVQLL